jgi:UDP-N-acetylmuramate dehydrogenase
MLGEIRGEVRFKEPLAFHTSLRCGGPADIFIMPQDVDDVRKALMFADKEKLPVAVLGSGHNTLVRDRGFRGLVLKIEGCLARMEFHGEEVTLGCGASLSAMIREAAAVGLGGIESLVGIPATLGGALATNAGTRDGAIWDFVSAVYFLYPDGSIGELKPAPGTLADRAVVLPAGAILLGVRLQLHRKPQKEIQAEIRARLKHKKATQPLALATAGFVWRSPDFDQVARLMERAGLKGRRVGAAEISVKHPNFIINRGGATARDVLALMELALERVHAQTGVRLVPELRVIGE